MYTQSELLNRYKFETDEICNVTLEAIEMAKKKKMELDVWKIYKITRGVLEGMADPKCGITDEAKRKEYIEYLCKKDAEVIKAIKEICPFSEATPVVL